MTSTEQAGDPGQPALLPREAARASARSAKGRAKPPRAGNEPTTTDPVARVLVDLPLAHLDRPFDYVVPAKYADTAVPGARVKVRFAGQDVDGLVLDRVSTSDHAGRLQPLRRVVSPEPVLSPEIAELSGLVADRQAGTRSDVLRLAIPPRHAATEKQPGAVAPSVTVSPRPDAWSAYDGGRDALAGLAEGVAGRNVLTVLPGDDWADLLVEAVVATASTGHGALVCVPDHRDVARLDAALSVRIGAGAHVVLTADAGPARRYRAFLAVARGDIRVVIGTRAAAFAPVRDLGLVAIWDDGDDLFEEPRAPYPHTRDVLLLRAEQTGCAAVLAAYARSTEAEYLVRTGWARDVRGSRERVRERVAVTVTGDSAHDLARDPHQARVPREVSEVLRSALEAGPALVQTPRAGYTTRLACDRCRGPALCAQCRGPLRITGRGRPPECAWCGTAASGWRCPDCEGQGLRAPVVGDRRTAEELGRAFPGVPVRTSSAGQVVDRVPDRPAIVVATPGAEPVAEGGYAAVILLDTWLLLSRADLRAGEEALRRWMNAAALVRPPASGGRVLVVGEPSAPALQALVRWDPAGLAEREIAERRSAHLPPASVVATLTAAGDDVEAALAALDLPPAAEVLGPAPVDEPTSATDPVDPDGPLERAVVRVPRRDRADLVRALRDLQAARSLRKLPHVRVQVDPRDLG